MATYIEQSLAKLKEFEGCVPWMYRDTVGKVTVGVGLMLPDAGAAMALGFTALGKPVASAAVAADFARVAAMPEGKSAGFYRSSESPELPQAAIDDHLQALLTKFEANLRGALPGYDALPDAIKLALLDMAYNLGPEGLLGGYPRLITAVKQSHWAQAAAECARHGPSVARNTWTREQFLSAVVTTIKAEAETWLARLLQWFRSLWRKRELL